MSAPAKRACLAAGLLLLAAGWLSPLPGLLPGAFSAHMAVHMAVVAAAAPLLALGLSSSRLPSALAAPVPVSFAELAVVWAWHAPALHHFARHSALGFALEQGSFLLFSLWLWRASLQARAAGVIGLLLTSMHMTLLGALLALATRPLYAHHGAGALADQELGGVIMLVGGGVAYLAGGLALTAQLLAAPRGLAQERR